MPDLQLEVLPLLALTLTHLGLASWGQTTTFGGEPSAALILPVHPTKNLHNISPARPPILTCISTLVVLHAHTHAHAATHRPPHRHGIDHCSHHFCIDSAITRDLSPPPTKRCLATHSISATAPTDKTPTARHATSCSTRPPRRPPSPCFRQTKTTRVALPWPLEVDGDNALSAPTTA